MTLIVAAHDEEDVIERRVENLLQLDYPAEKLEIVVASDASSDRTDELVEAIATREPRVRLIRAPRGGKVAAQNLAVRETGAARSSPSPTPNATWPPDALAEARAQLRRPRGRVRLRARDLRRRRRHEPRGRVLGVRALAARAGVAARLDHGRQRPDLRGAARRLRRRRPALRPRPGVPVPDGAARAAARSTSRRRSRVEKPSRDLEDEYRRKVRMFEHCWLITLRGRMLRDVDPRLPRRARSRTGVLRYGSGLLHLGVLGANVASLGRGRIYRRRARQAGGAARACRRRQVAASGAGRRARVLLRARHLGDCGLARRLPARTASRRSGRRRRARAEPRARRRGRLAGPGAREPVPGRVGARDQAARTAAPSSTASAVSGGRRGVRAPEAPHDGRRRREAGRGLGGQQGRPAHHAASGASCGGSRSTSSRSSGTSSAAT